MADPASSSASSSTAQPAAGKKPPTLNDIATRLKLDTPETTLVSSSANKENTPTIEAAQPLKGRLGLPGRLNSFQSEGDSSGHSALQPLAHGAPPSDRSSVRASPVLGSSTLHPESAVAAVLPQSEGSQGQSKPSSSKTKGLPSLEEIRDRMSKKSQPAEGAGPAALSSDRRTDEPSNSATGPAATTSGWDTPPVLPTAKAAPTSSVTANITTQAPMPPAVDKGAMASEPSDLHPLQHEWTLFFDSKTFDPASAGSNAAESTGGKANIDAYAPWLAKAGETSTTASATSPTSQTPLKGGASSESWEAALKRVGQYHTVESFLQVFAKIRRPSSLDKQASYHLFKDGIKPMWEDPANAQGGKWVISFQRSVVNPALLDRSWMWLVLALIGEELDADDDVTGAVVSLRPKADRIALWLRGKEDVTKINSIGRRLVNLLEIEDKAGITVEFNTHAGGGRRSRTPASPSGSWDTFWGFDNSTSAQNQGSPAGTSTSGNPSSRQPGGIQQSGNSRGAPPQRQSAFGGSIGRMGAGGGNSGGLVSRV